MAIDVGVNSYVSPDEAAEYFSGRIGADVWDAAGIDIQEKALITATQILDECAWEGIAVDNSQLLAFPRNITFYDPKIGMPRSYSGDIPQRLKQAAFELAFHLVENPTVLSDGGSVKNLAVANISLGTIRQAEIIPFHVKMIIKPMLVNQGKNTWWRAN